MRRPSPLDVDDASARHLIAGYAVTVHCALTDEPFLDVRLGTAAHDDLTLGLLISAAVGRTVGECLYEQLLSGALSRADMRAMFIEVPHGEALRSRLRAFACAPGGQRGIGML